MVAMVCIRELYREDIPRIALFLASQTGSSRESVHARLAWLANNPAAQPDIPLGISAFHGEDLSGTMILIPNRFSNGSAPQTCILSALFYVDERVRGVGLPLFLKFRSLSCKYPLYAATANIASAPLWKSLGGMPDEDSDHEFFRIVRWKPVFAEIFRIGREGEDSTEAGLSPRDPKLSLAPMEISEVQGQPTPNHARDFEIMRDQTLLAWKVYSRGQKVYRFAGGASNSFCIFQHDRRGHNHQIKSTEIIDIWGEVARPDWGTFLRAVARMFSPDVITFRGASSVARLGFSEEGFRRRKFKTAAVWLIDPNRFLEGRFRYSSLAGE